VPILAYILLRLRTRKSAGKAAAGAATQMPTPSEDVRRVKLIVRFDCTVLPQAGVPGGSDGTLKVIW
jgi:hypothetical protein